MTSRNTHYAYFLPNGKSGITESWATCEKIVRGNKGARYKGFKSRKEAVDWISSGALYDIKVSVPAEEGIYFDAGTGRGEGVEISVTDEKGNDLLGKIMSKELVNKHGKHLLSKGKTNNYGELLACLFAIRIAAKENVMNIFGDSKLVIDYWSKGFIKKEVDGETINLAKIVASERRTYENKGGEISRVPGDDNPADLGFHR